MIAAALEVAAGAAIPTIMQATRNEKVSLIDKAIRNMMKLR